MRALFSKMETLRRWRSNHSWHLELQCELFKASRMNSLRDLPRKFFRSLSLSFFLSVLNNQEKRKWREDESFFFYFQSRLLYVRRATIILSYSSRRDAIKNPRKKMNENKQREKLICVARMWQKHKLWRDVDAINRKNVNDSLNCGILIGGVKIKII